MKIGNQSQQLIINPLVADFFGDLTGKTVLDAGCGNGYWTRRMAQTAKRVIGVDINDELVKLNKSRGCPENAEFIIGNLEKLLLTADTFDVVLMNMVLSDLENIASVVRELTRVTRAGGKIIVSTERPFVESSQNFKLSDYINTFAKNHLFVEKMVEPDGFGIFKNSEIDKEQGFLIVRFKKMH